jgi:signal transduction histidine kinase
MMGRLFGILLIFFISIPSFAQTTRLDSLIIALKNSNKENYREVFSKIEDQLVKEREEISLPRVEEISLISSKLNFHGPISGAYRCLAIVLEKSRQKKKAIQAIEKANEVALRYGLQLERADNLRVLADIFRMDGKFNIAFKNYIDALKIYESFKKHDKEVLLIYTYLGDIYYKTHHYSIARQYLVKAYQNGQKKLDSRTLINILNTIALVHRQKNEYNQALYYHKRALQLAIDVKDTAWVGIANGNVGRIYQLKKDYDLAIPHFKVSVRLSQKYEEWGDVIVNMSRMSDIYLEHKDYITSKVYLDSALAIADKQSEYESKQYLYWVLTKYYRTLKQTEKAFEYQSMYTEVKDSIEKKNYIEEIDEMRSTFELEKKQSQIELLQKANELISESEQKKTYILLLTFLLLAFTAIVIFLLYRSNYLKVKANELLRSQQKELREKSEEIQRQNSEISDLNNSLEKMVQERTKQLEEANENLTKQNQNLEQFSYVISHNLRAPIAQILGLLSVINKESLQSEFEQNLIDYLHKAASNLDMIVNDLNAILLMRNQSTENKERVSLSEVCAITIESMRSLIEAEKATVHCDFSKVDTIFSNKTFLNSILYNLISNGIKYRDHRRDPEIWVRACQSEAYVCLSVSDNGLGLDLEKIKPEKLFKLYSRMHTHTEGKGMGLFIVKEQVDSLNGKIEVESKPGVGTTFRIYLPV